ncbi:MAG: PhnD/SsuA/transferrin family substrate-binding protein [Desulfobacteraceae bacterium]|jgi:ABC-type phosphate/phosphonate transport system substrate-binding protein
MNSLPPKPHYRAMPLDRLSRYACIFAAILALCWTHQAFALDRLDFYFASLDNTHTGMHAKESRMAMQSIMQKIFAPKYPEMRLHLDFLDRDGGLVEVMTSKQYDVIATTGLDYLELRGRIRLRPLVILSKTEQPTDTFLLITRKNKTLKTLAGLPNRTLIIEACGGDIAKLWLDTQLEAHGLPRHQEFFHVVRTGDKPSRTLLPVFFGQADACVVSESAFAVMSELNPQLKEKLAVEVRSAGYISILISATERLEDWARDIVMEETLRMHTIPDGRQILTIMQMKRFFPFKPEYLESAERIFRDHQRSGGGG